MKTLLAKRWIRLAIAYLVAMVLYSITLHLDWFLYVDRTAYDLGTVLRPPPDEGSPVVLIAIDQNTLSESFPAPPFPVSRHLNQHARLIKRLDSAGVAYIVFDILFDRLENVEDSSRVRFLLSLEKSGKVVLAGVIEKEDILDEKGGKVMFIEQLCTPSRNFQNAAAGFGLINVPVDNDGRIRRINLRRRLSDQMIPTLAFTTAALFVGDKQKILERVGDTMLMDYSLVSSEDMKIPYSKVLLGDGWQDQVRGKIAIIGVTESRNGSIDSYKTPLSIIAEPSSGRMPGIEIQSIALRTLISGREIKQLSLTAIYFAGVLVLFIVFWMVDRSRPLIGLLEAGGAVVAVVLAAISSLTLFRISIPIAPMLFGIINGAVITIVLNMMNLKFAHEHQERFVADVKSDLVSAHDIQERLQPKEFPEDDRIEIAGIQIPCKAVGGDYYDVVTLPGEKLGILIADVAGKGVGGSLIMSNIQGCFRQVADDYDSPSAVFQRINNVVKAAANIQHFFVTALYGILDPAGKTLIYSNAGHGFPIICSKDGKARVLEGGELPLGILQENQWADREITLDVGDTICMYTDGISEASKGDSDEMFGEERIQTCLTEKYSESARSICDFVLEQCRQYVGESEFDDDWTILVIKLK